MIRFYTLIVSLVFVFCFANESFAQDRHFTQFYAVPLTLNPALTGQMSGKYRMTAIFRNQWQTVLDKPFKTVGASFDMNVPVGIDESDKFGVGVQFFSDQGGQTVFTTNSIAINAAFHKAMDLRKHNYLSGGLQIGLVQRSVNFENFTFNDQFDGSTGYTLTTSEEFPVNSFGFADISTGLFFTSSPEKRTNYHFGLAAHHVNVPDVSFDETRVDRLNMSIAFHTGAQFPIGRRMDMLPRILTYFQGPHFEMNVGTNFRYIMNELNGTSFYLGGWVRPVKDVESSLALDAVVLLAAIEIDGVRFGLSLDANVSTLRSSSAGFGAFEISVAYTGQDDSKVVICPTF